MEHASILEAACLSGACEVHEPRRCCQYKDLLTLLFICLHNLVPGACTALQASKHPLFCALCKPVSDFCCTEIAYRRCLVKVSWQALHFCRCCSLYCLQTFSPVSWDVLPDTLHGTNCSGRAAKNPHSKRRCPCRFARMQRLAWLTNHSASLPC